MFPYFTGEEYHNRIDIHWNSEAGEERLNCFKNDPRISAFVVDMIAVWYSYTQVYFYKSVGYLGFCWFCFVLLFALLFVCFCLFCFVQSPKC